MYCPKCGKKFLDNETKCLFCGHDISNKTEIRSTHSIISLEENKKIIAITILIFLFALAFFVTRCGASGCFNTQKQGPYCINHMCGVSDCENQRMVGENYCHTHYSLFEEDNEDDYSGAMYLKISNVYVYSNSSYTIVEGTIKNTSLYNTYRFVEVKGAFKDYSGDTVETDWTYAVGSEGLSPGESTTFRMSVDQSYGIEDCEVTLLDYDVE